jgi:hypothetical protein
MVWNNADIHLYLQEEIPWKNTIAGQNKIITMLPVSNSLYFSDLVLLFFLNMCL